MARPWPTAGGGAALGVGGGLRLLRDTGDLVVGAEEAGVVIVDRRNDAAVSNHRLHEIDSPCRMLLKEAKS